MSTGAATMTADELLRLPDDGMRHVLVIDPARRTATAYRSRQDVHVYRQQDELDLSDAVPGWHVALGEFFR